VVLPDQLIKGLDPVLAVKREMPHGRILRRRTSAKAAWRGVGFNVIRAVRLALDHCESGAIPGSRLRPSHPAAHSGHRLRLLPSGPDRVHGSESRRTRPSTLLAGGCPVLQRPQARDRPGVSRVSGTGDPEPPTQHDPRKDKRPVVSQVTGPPSFQAPSERDSDCRCRSERDPTRALAATFREQRKRRRRDSNPWTPCGVTRSPGVPVSPLPHVSGRDSSRGVARP
jgi:hypothetical protein